MKNLTTATILGLSLLGTLHCGDSTGMEAGNESPVGDALPQLTEWETVVDKLPFPTSGDAKINRLTVGRKEYTNNFANRGDIEVHFDQDSDVISIELRKYDFSDDITAKGDEATGQEGTFERMSLWAYNEDGSNPAKPTEADAADPTKNCQLEAWKDGCSVYVYYDGLTQPVRSGADLRVHLPKAWRGELNVQTEDNEGETTYPRRSNVTITGPGEAGWCSSGTVKMSAGVGKIKLCRDLSVAPACSAAQIEACENFEKDGMPAAWDPTCGCNAMNFGQIRIESLKPWAADITVDMPDDLWLNATVANQSDAKPHECKPVLENCADGKCTLTTNDEYTKAGEFNYPGPAAPSGAGFNLTVLSAGCTLVDYFAKPDDWAADATPESEVRGHLKVCTGCLE
jgi:hypothetical protein